MPMTIIIVLSGPLLLLLRDFLYLSSKARAISFLGPGSAIAFDSLLLDYLAKDNPCSNIKRPLLMSDRSIEIGPKSKMNFWARE